MTSTLRIAGRPTDDEVAAVLAALVGPTAAAPVSPLAAWRAQRQRALARTAVPRLRRTGQHTT